MKDEEESENEEENANGDEEDGDEITPDHMIMQEQEEEEELWVPPMSHTDPKLQCTDSVEEIPLLEPSEEEFADPIKYIRSIAAHGERYGIAVIQPPPSWKAKRRGDPGLDPNFRFKTKRQNLAPLQRRDGSDPGFELDKGDVSLKDFIVQVK